MISADQIKRLEALQSKLIDLYLDEMQPENWPQDVPDDPKATKAARGDRVWHKKDANLTITHAIRIETLLKLRQEGQQAGEPGEDEETEKLTAEAMATAATIIKRAQGTRFGKREK